MLKSTLFLLAVVGCAFPRPADVNACTPGEFAGCQGDTQLTCNSAGTDVDAVQCARGCDPGAGCRLCEANQTVCTNGEVQACDATGAIASSESCALGCFEDQPRCREIAPSNGLAAIMDLASNGPDLVLENANLSIPGAMVTTAKGEPVKLQSVMVNAPPDGVSIQVFPVRSLSIIGQVNIVPGGAGMSAAIAFMVHGDVTLNGTLAVRAGLGAIDSGACVGEVGIVDAGPGNSYYVGSGGGGGATQGGNGGGSFYPARQGGAAYSNPDLQPLRGGCNGGTPAGFIPGHGGGALQITSRSSIRLAANSAIEANGLVGFAGSKPPGLPTEEWTPGGGGGGGGILLEAPHVSLDSGATLVANGGAGTNGNSDAGVPPSGRVPSVGTDCTNDCSRGGHGGSIGTPGTDGPSIVDSGQRTIATGAGGGSIGYIRINTTSGVYIEANDVFKSPVPSTGNIATR